MQIKLYARQYLFIQPVQYWWLYGPTSNYLTQGQLGASEGHHATPKEHTQV